VPSVAAAVVVVSSLLRRPPFAAGRRCAISSLCFAFRLCLPLPTPLDDRSRYITYSLPTKQRFLSAARQQAEEEKQEKAATPSDRVACVLGLAGWLASILACRPRFAKRRGGEGHSAKTTAGKDTIFFEFWN